MSAKDYKICPTLLDVFIAKVSKRNPTKLLKDRRALTEKEIIMIIDWWLDSHCEVGEAGKIMFKSIARPQMYINVEFIKKGKK